jgi:hypothetical protein
MSTSISPPIDTSNPSTVQGIFTTSTETPRKKLSRDDKTLTTRRKRLLDAHASSPQFKVNPKNNINSSQVDTDSQKTSGKSEKNKSLKNSSNSKLSDIKGSDESPSDDEDSIVGYSDSSDDDLEDLMPKERREKIENQLIQPSTRVKRTDYERQEQKEKAAVQEKRIRKYAMDFVAGGLLQFTSFGIGGFATIGTGNPGLFPVVVPFSSPPLVGISPGEAEFPFLRPWSTRGLLNPIQPHSQPPRGGRTLIDSPTSISPSFDNIRQRSII